MNEPGAVPGDALEDVAYLARSENRVRILGALVAGARPRRELAAVTGTARTTLGRVLGELEERGWAERTADGDYAATATGELVFEEFRPVVEAMATVETLGAAATWIPVEESSVGLGEFRNASVRRSDSNAPLELVEYLADLVRRTDTLLVLTFLAPPSPVGQAIDSRVPGGASEMEFVLAGGLTAFLRDQDHHPPAYREFVEAGGRIYRYDGHIPCNLFVGDETVLLMSDRPAGSTAAIESEDGTVRRQLVELYEDYRDEAEPVEAEYFG